MAEISPRANNQQTIAGKNTGTPAKSNAAPYSDLSMASLAPTGTPGDNVFGVSAAPAPNQAPIQGNAYDPAAADVSSPTQFALGSDEWQKIKLASAIEQLRKHYGQLAAQSGGTLQDPYWDREYDKAVQAEADAISNEASGYRQTAEENAANRNLQASEGAANRDSAHQISADQLDSAAKNRKAEEHAAMYGGAGQLGLGLLTTPSGGGLKWVPGTDAFNPGHYEPAQSTTLGGRGLDALKNSFTSDPSRNIPGIVSDSFPVASPTGMESLASGRLPSPPTAYNPGGISDLNYENPGVFGGDAPMRVPGSPNTPANSFSMWDKLKGGFVPSAVGAGVGTGMGALFGAKKYNAGMGALTGFGSGMAASALGLNKVGSGALSAGMAFANPFDKASWGGNKDKGKTWATLIKLGGTAGLTALLG